LESKPGDISRSQFRKTLLNPGKSDWSCSKNGASED
jgi:hypothetical protein